MSLASSGPIETKKSLKPLAMSLLLVAAALLIVRQSCVFSELLFRARIKEYLPAFKHVTTI